MGSNGYERMLYKASGKDKGGIACAAFARQGIQNKSSSYFFTIALCPALVAGASMIIL